MALAPFRDLLSAFRQDVTTTRYRSEAELFDYCRRSANPIGRLMLRIFDADAPANLAASDAICTALQLINFWQDVAADWAKGRIYLPAEDLDRFGVSESHIAEGRCDAAWNALMAFESERARALLESGRPLTRALPWRLRTRDFGRACRRAPNSRRHRCDRRRRLPRLSEAVRQATGPPSRAARSFLRAASARPETVAAA
jgi:squalene synthase HpnC